MDFSGAKVFDFTGKSGRSGYESFGQEVIEALRKSDETKLAVVLDTGLGFAKPAPYLVQDHLNLSGYNPLIGPNHEIGERFPVVNGIYVTDVSAANLPALERGIAVGIKPGVEPSADELARLYFLGGNFCCYNLVPTMLVAAHAGWRVLAVVGPSGNGWQKEVIEGLKL